MQILMLTGDFFPNIGGIAAHVAGLAGGLTTLGHGVTVVVPGPVRPWTPRWTTEDTTLGYRVLRVGVPFVARLRRLHSIYAAPHVARGLQRQVSGGAEVVHWHTFEHPVVQRVTGVAKVFTNHTSQFLEYAADPDQRTRAHQIVAPADAVIAPSRQLADATRGAGYPAERVHIIPNGVDTSRFSPATDGRSVRRRYGIADDECVIICPRRLEKKNGVIYWVRAIPILLANGQAQVRFLFVGDYQYDDQYSARAEVLSAISALGLGEQIIFTGAIPNQDMPAFFAASDIVMLPSLMEATSIAGLEAMASGKPLVGTNVGGIPEIVADSATGLLVEPANPAALAAAAQRLVAAPVLRRTLGAAARDRVEREFSWTAIASQTLSIYEKALQGRR